MKKIRIILTMFSLVIAGLISPGCEKNNSDQTGSIDFGMATLDDNTLKSLQNRGNVSAALVTIINQFGEKVYDKEYLEFYAFGESFVTKSLTLAVGKYQLTEFFLVDTAKTITWATPVEGSRLAELVNDPVPIEFGVYENNTTHLYPEVVQVTNYNADQFGYVNFNVKFVDGFCIRVYLESMCGDWMYLDSVEISPDGFAYPYYQSSMMILSEDDTLAIAYLYPGENGIHIPRGHEVYRIIVTDCRQMICYDSSFKIEELKTFTCQQRNYLYITCGPDLPDPIITPEDITEATIDQGVFGKITEPAWDSTSFEDYVIQPLVTDLYIFKAEFSDTLVMPMNMTDCYQFPTIYRDPLAIVRSNSGGFYQMPLEAGDYDYMVKTPYGYYIDAYVSSHYPGKFTVVAGEVTELNIHVQLCRYY